MDFGELEGSPEKVLSRLQEESLESASKLGELMDELSGAGAKVGLSVKIVRGIDYYTSTVYEAFDLKSPELGALAGGGRYDLLPSIFGRKDLPATGVAGGAERLLLALEGGGGSADRARRPVYVAAASGMLREAIAVASGLRSAGIQAVTDLQRRTLARQMEEAVRAKASKVVIVGPAEFSHGEAVVRDMDTRKEERLKLDGLAKAL